MNNLLRLILISAFLGVVMSVFGQSAKADWALLPQDQPRATQTATLIGPKPSTDTIHLTVMLPYADPVGIQKFIDSVSNPKSPNYRQFLTPLEVGQQFGLPAASVQKVTDYLTSQGMTIRLVALNRLSILADCTVAQAQAAFNTTIQQYKVPDQGGAIRFAFTNPPAVPSSIRPYVSCIGGMENFLRPIPKLAKGGRGGKHGKQEPNTFLSPSMIRQLYGIASVYSSYKGTGRTIAISNWQQYELTNVPLDIKQFNLPYPSAGMSTNITPIPVDGCNGNTTSTSDEEGDLDIQTTLDMAPLATILIYDNSGENDLPGVLTQEANDNKADIITESYGWPTSGYEQYLSGCHTIHQSMSAQGITYMAASGDSLAPGVVSTSYPDEDPEVLIVGGTSVKTDASGNRLAEAVWNDYINLGNGTQEHVGGGGGWNPNSDPWNTLPAYQKGTGVPTNIPYRLSPDIALDADLFTGYEIFLNGTFTYQQYYIGGTSAASPTFAGALADAEQDIIAKGGLAANSKGYQRFGRLQDLLYSFNGSSSVFYDITVGNNSTLPNGSTSNATVGWDTASGWGAPILSGFVTKVLNQAVPTSVTFNPSTVAGGVSSIGTVTISIPAGASGQVVNLSSNSTSATVPASVTVASGKTTATFTIATSAVVGTTTATITASANNIAVSQNLTISPSGLASIAVAPTSVTGGTSSTGTVTLTGPASSAGLTVNLSSGSSSAVVAQTVTVAAGNSSATFTITTSPVSSATSATITAAQGTNTYSAILTVNPPSLIAFALSPTSVQGGASSTGAVTLNGPAPSAGTIITLSSNSGSATVPTSVTVLSGAKTATFTVKTSAVSASTAAAITATQSGNSTTATLTITPATLSSVAVSPATVTGGTSSTGTVTLTGAAGPNGTTVNLTSSSANATLPTSVTVSAGSTTATFTITTKAVSTSTTATISAVFGGVTQTATLTINAPVVSSVSLSPAAVTGLTSSTGTITLSGPAGPSGVVVSLASSNANAVVPASVTVAAGATSTTFTVTTKSVATVTSATITGTANSSSQSATLTINPPALVSVTLSPTSVVGTSSSTGTVTIGTAAPTGGLVISLASNSTSATVPTSVTIAAGAKTATFTVTTTAVSTATVATISATSNGVTQSANLTVNPPVLTSLTISPAVITGTGTATGTVKLSAIAPTGGSTITLVSSSTVASVPATVTVPAGASSATFVVTGNGSTLAVQAKITATYNSAAPYAFVTVDGSVALSIAPSPTSFYGGVTSTAWKIYVGVPVTTATTITLQSNNAALTVPTTVTIPAGSFSAYFTVTSTPVATNQSVIVTATGAGTTATTTVTVKAPIATSLTLSPTAVVGGSPSTGTITLSSAAPAGGLVVNLTSSSANATLPATLTVPAGATSVTFTVNTLAVTTATTATITATTGATSVKATLTINI